MNKEDLKDTEYISKIDDIVDEIKDVSLILTVTKIQKVEIERAIIVGLNLKDESGTILGIFVGKRKNDDVIKTIKNFDVDKKYKIKGNIIIIDKHAISEFTPIDELVFKKFNVKVDDKTIAIKEIEKISN